MRLVNFLKLGPKPDFFFFSVFSFHAVKAWCPSLFIFITILNLEIDINSLSAMAKYFSQCFTCINLPYPGPSHDVNPISVLH